MKFPKITFKRLLILYLCFKFYTTPNNSGRIFIDQKSAIKKAYKDIYLKSFSDKDKNTNEKKEFKFKDYIEIQLPKYKVGPDEFTTGFKFLKEQRNKPKDHISLKDAECIDKGLAKSILEENNYKEYKANPDEEEYYDLDLDFF
jgi:hypothetical protein